MVSRDAWPRRTRAEHGDLRIGGALQAAVGGGAFALAALAVLAFAIPLDGGEQWAELGTLLVYASASYVAGSAVGVLFGVPRSHTEHQGSISRATNAPNTNLEQISDWLTKIIVGVGLVQARSIADGFARVVDRMADGLATPDAAAFVGALTLYSGGVGFLTGWLLARVWLARLLSASDMTLPNEPAGRRPATAPPARKAPAGVSTGPLAAVDADPGVTHRTP